MQYICTALAWINVDTNCHQNIRKITDFRKCYWTAVDAAVFDRHHYQAGYFSLSHALWLSSFHLIFANRFRHCNLNATFDEQRSSFFNILNSTFYISSLALLISISVSFTLILYLWLILFNFRAAHTKKQHVHILCWGICGHFMQ